MLPEPLHQSYSALFATLDQLESLLKSEDSKLLQQTWPNLQNVFRSLVTGVNEAIAENMLEPEQASRIQSIHTEMNKGLRLLNTDIVFLNTAKQPTTIQQRQKQIGDRLQSMRQYGEAALSLWTTSTSDADG
ncbi:MAG: heterocyst frequency control protein PatD [Elainellaceae cyanobacterium]